MHTTNHSVKARVIKHGYIGCTRVALNLTLPQFVATVNGWMARFEIALWQLFSAAENFGVYQISFSELSSRPCLLRLFGHTYRSIGTAVEFRGS